MRRIFFPRYLQEIYTQRGAYTCYGLVSNSNVRAQALALAHIQVSFHLFTISTPQIPDHFKPVSYYTKAAAGASTSAATEPTTTAVLTAAAERGRGGCQEEADAPSLKSAQSTLRGIRACVGIPHGGTRPVAVAAGCHGRGGWRGRRPGCLCVVCVSVCVRGGCIARDEGWTDDRSIGDINAPHVRTHPPTLLVST